MSGENGMIRVITVHHKDSGKKTDLHLHSNIEELEMEEIIDYFKEIGYVEGNSLYGEKSRIIPIKEVDYIHHKTKKYDEGKRYFF